MIPALISLLSSTLPISRRAALLKQKGYKPTKREKTLAKVMLVLIGIFILIILLTFYWLFFI